MITIKEEFVGGDKWVRAVELGGPEAILMWLALKRYAAQHLTGGFVPDEEVKKLPGAPKRAPRALEALRMCGRMNPSGERGDGLVQQTEHGWMLHDYDDHANSVAEEELRREKARERKRNWRKQKEAELAELRAGRDSAGHRDGTARDIGTGQRGTSGRDVTDQSDDCPSGTHTRAGACAPTRGGARIPNPTQPNPTQPEGEGAPPPPPPRALSSAQRQALALQWATPEDVEVLEAWRDRFKKTDVTFTADRAVPIAERRACGMTQQDALDALAGAERNEWFMSKGAPLSLMFSGQERFEEFRDAGRAIREGRPPPQLRRRARGGPPQNDHGMTGWEEDEPTKVQAK